MINPALVIAVLLYFVSPEDRSADYARHSGATEPTHEIFTHTIQRYSRDVTVLEIGNPSKDSPTANASDYPSSVFVVLGKEQEKNELAKNVIWLNHSPTLENIQKLSLSEHFDIIVLNWPIKDQWIKAISLCKHMAHHVIVNLPTPVLLKSDGPFSLIKRSMVHPRTIQRKFTVHYDYDEKYLVKVRPPYPDQKSTWIPGINLLTYLSFNGTHPDRETVVSKLPLDYEHLDWMPNNMIIQGESVVLVDKGDPTNLANIAGTTRLYRDEFNRTAQLILDSQSKTADAVKRLFCKIYNVEGLLHIEESD